MSARKSARPELTELQRRHVKRAREVAASDAETIATAYDRINPDDAGQVYAYAYGVSRSTIADLLEILDELTASGRAGPANPS